jgi:hypothetical protein
LFIKLKIQNIFIYSILAIGLISIPSLLDTVQAQINMTNATSSSLQNQTAQTAQNQTAAAAGANQTAQTAQNQTAAAAGANQTISTETQALMSLDFPELKGNLMDSKDALANNDTEEALTTVTDVENQVLVLKVKPSFADDIQKLKDSISKPDINKALDDLTKVQTDVLKAENEVFKAQLANPQLKVSQQDNDDNQDEDDEDN